MTIESLVCIAIAIGTVAGTTWLRRRRLRERERLPVEELVAGLAEQSAAGFAELAEAWRELAQALGVEPELLRPDDRLDRLAVLPNWLAPWDHGAWTRTGALVDRLRRKVGRDVDLSGVRAVGDYLLVWCEPSLAPQFAARPDPPSAASYGCGGCLLGGVGAAVLPILLVSGMADQALGEIYILPVALIGMVVGTLLGSRAWEEKFGRDRPDDLVLRPPARPPSPDDDWPVE